MPAPDTITAVQLSRLIGLPDAPVLLDVRTGQDLAADPRLIPTSTLRHHASAPEWAAEFAGRSVVVICQRGLKLSQGTAAWLRHAGASGVDPGRGPSYSLYALALDAAVGGAGILIGRRSVVAPYLADGRLIAPFADEVPSGDRLTMLFPPAGKPHPRRGDVVAWLEVNA